jgi:hypothetical protein
MFQCRRWVFITDLQTIFQTYKVAVPVLKVENTAVGIRSANHATPFYLQKLVLTSPTSGGRSVGIVCSRTKATALLLLLLLLLLLDSFSLI